VPIGWKSAIGVVAALAPHVISLPSARTVAMFAAPVVRTCVKRSVVVKRYQVTPSVRAKQLGAGNRYGRSGVIVLVPMMGMAVAHESRAPA
jgi:hypothetical protein